MEPLAVGDTDAADTGGGRRQRLCRRATVRSAQRMVTKAFRPSCSAPGMPMPIMPHSLPPAFPPVRGSIFRGPSSMRPANRTGVVPAGLCGRSRLCAGDAFFFSCERVNAPKVDRSALQAHANGVRRIRAVEARAGDAGRCRRAFSQRLRGALSPRARVEAVMVPLANADRCRSSVAGSHRARPLAGCRRFCRRRSCGVARSLLARNGIEHDLIGHRLVIAPAPGQGAAFIFEEQK